jgi:hypothetical protein
MYKKIEEKKKIKNFLCLNKILAYTLDNVFFINGDQYNIAPILLKFDITKNNVWLKDENWENYLININESILTKLDFNIGLNGEIKDMIFIFKNSIRSCLSTITNKIIINVGQVDNIKYYMSFGNFIYCHIENYFIKSLSVLTGEYKWTLDLKPSIPKDDYIKNIFGIAENLLWLTTYWGILIGIDINNGTVKHLLNFGHVDFLPPDSNSLSTYSYSLFDEVNKKLCGVYNKQYWEIDLTKPETSLKQYNLTQINPDYFKNEWANPEGMRFDNKYIYCRDLEISTVSIIERHTGKIVWYEPINDLTPRPSIIISDIQIGDNNLYVLDTSSTLHIFEKE